MSKTTEEFKFNNLGIIHNIDEGNYYSIYGVTTLIVLVMLLWFFIRTNISNNSSCRENMKSYNNNSCRENMFPLENYDVLSMMPEFQEKDIQPIKLTDEKYNIKSGEYGNVIVNFYDVNDIIYDREWDTNKNIYLPNLRTSFKKVNLPYQAILTNNREMKDLNDAKPEQAVLDKAKQLINTQNIADAAKNVISNEKMTNYCNKERMGCNKERMGCNKERMGCNKERMGCNKERMSDYICYRCGKYGYECLCRKKIDVFNPICPYCKEDVKDCICYKTDYHSYMWRNRYFDREKL